jgi:hypothetical protein
MTKQEIAQRLRKALLEGGVMSKALYEFELQEHIGFWHKGLIRDREDLVFVVTENMGKVAMVLITRDKTVYINEEARRELAKVWKLNYENNIEILLPAMAGDLFSGQVAITGVKVVNTSKKKKAKKSLGFG